MNFLPYTCIVNKNEQDLKFEIMIRDMVKIDEEKCTGCGQCVPGCHEGALQIIDGKARLISDLMCDGLGACIGHCPEDAITIEKREAEPYNETKVMEIMVGKGKNTVIAHLKHLKEHEEFDFLKEGVDYLKEHEGELSFTVQEVLNGIRGEGIKSTVHAQAPVHGHGHSHGHHHGGGCPGAREQSFKPVGVVGGENVSGASQLQQWPVQLHLVSPEAGFFRDSDVVIAADCVAFALGNFHDKYLKGKSLAIACPKLDQGMDVYKQKVTAMIDRAKVNTINVMIMEVPCCGGLLQMVQAAVAEAERKVPVKVTTISVQGQVIAEEWA